MISLEETSDGVFMLEERELEENSQYLVHVIASNDVGAIQSTPVQISMYYNYYNECLIPDFIHLMACMMISIWCFECAKQVELASNLCRDSALL